MNKRTDIAKMLEKESRRYEKIISYARKELAKAPEGTVQIRKHNNGIQFYYRSEFRQKNGTYLPASKRQFAILLVQKRYLERVVKTAVRQKTAIDRFLRSYDAEAVRKIYSEEGTTRQRFIQAIELPDAQFKEDWEMFQYERKSIRDDVPEHYTERGERVRSKSEVLIADALYRAGIPYRYECPLRLGGSLIHPDFTVLRMSDRKELYWEHLGMMDDMEYRNHAIQRVRDYEEKGIYPGESLIISAETLKMPLNKKVVEGMIRQYLS